MKNKSAQKSIEADLLEEDIRDYAYHLYEQSGRRDGHDQEHWLEAKACLLTNIPRQDSHNRLHRHLEYAAAGR